MANKRLVWVDLLRALAAFCVVAIHVTSLGIANSAAGSFDYIVYHAVKSIVKAAVPVFFMISGMLFLNPEKELAIKTVYAKYIMRILTAFFFWSVLYAFHNIGISGGGFNSVTFRSFADSVFNGEYHQWYLLAIAALYALVPVLKKITADMKVCGYLLVLLFAVAFVNPAVALVPQLNFLTGFIDRFGISVFASYGFYFIAGYYFLKAELSKRAEKLIYVCGILGLLASIAVPAVLGESHANFVAAFDSISLPQTAVYAVAVFVLFRRRVSGLSFGKRSSEVISLIARNGLGIYLSHIFFHSVLQLNGEKVSSYPSLLVIPVCSVCVFAFAFAFSYLISKIPILNRYVT